MRMGSTPAKCLNCACYSQGRTIEELMANMREVIVLCLEEEGELDSIPEFVGVQRIYI